MFADRIKQLRKENRITQETIAKHLNIARPSYTRYETGEREPDFETVRILAEYYRVSIDFLLEMPAAEPNEEEYSITFAGDDIKMLNKLRKVARSNKRSINAQFNLILEEYLKNNKDFEKEHGEIITEESEDA